MPLLDYKYCVGQTVYHIDENTGIRAGVVKKVDGTIQYGSTKLQYQIQYVKTSQGFATVDEDTLFPNPDSAWDAYKHKFLEQ